MALYRLTKSLVVFDPTQKRAFTIPAHSLVEKQDLIDAIALTDVRWSGRSVWVPIQDLLERCEPLG
jgi:hypothetical protein